MIEVSEESQVVVSPEDQARAGLYGLIANIFHAPPSGDILKAIAEASLIDGHAESPLAAAWRQLQETSAIASEGRLRQEYDELFIGVGKPEIMLYGSYYLSGFLMEKPLAKLREHLSHLGFKRRLSVGEPEDHLSALCEVMRGLIVGSGELPAAPVETQKEFFHRHLSPWAPKLADALIQNTRSEFYARAGKFAQVFFQIEKESFEIT
ncbi:MAG: TorD/DmsD family molecular chaperone [Burkholderiales bacterium]